MLIAISLYIFNDLILIRIGRNSTYVEEISNFMYGLQFQSKVQYTSYIIFYIMSITSIHRPRNHFSAKYNITWFAPKNIHPFVLLQFSKYGFILSYTRIRAQAFKSN